MPVIGMGGYFFRAQDPQALKTWYRERLDVGGGCGTDEKGESNEWVWFVQGGPMVFEPFKADSDYFAAEKQAMINLRVTDLEGLLADLRGAGVEVTREETMEGLGRFARVHDPEGNAIELWEPESEAGQTADGQ
ncbi:MAG TPA: VOC family protein [Allosphingosinicella sp.]|jgi:predicted enzyme related to lactoylglutathione lyase